MKYVIILILLAGAGYGYYYECEKTLMLSEIIGPTDNPTADVLVNLFDFDTGLTRYDMYRLSRKAPYWHEQIERVNAIADPAERQRENDVLMAEMMRDPTLKKIAQGALGFSANIAKSIIQASTDFKLFDL